MSLVAVPSQSPTTASPGRRWMLWVVPLLALLLAAGYLVISVTSPRVAAGIGINGGQFYAVTPSDMEVKVRQKGELQAVNNIDIVCQVEGQTVITTIVKEGASVKKGQVLATMDASAIKQKIEDATLDIQKAEADVSTSKEMRDIQDS